MPGQTPVLAAAICLAGPALAEPAFLDGFDTLDEDRWMISDGWSNGDWMNCTWSRDAVSLRDGHLVLQVQPETPDATGHRCGEIQSRAQFGHGTFEVRMRTGAGSGLNAAFFTYIGPVHGRAHHEIDVEILLRDTARATFNTFVEGAETNGGSAPLDGRSDTGFHTYAFTWSPESIAWFVDGAEVHRTAPGTPIPQAPQKIYASLWSSASFPDWMGPFDASSLPVEAEIDWIAFTPLGAPCAFAASVLCGGR
ncbi:MAG: licheninase [Rhodobacteraceae bacterium HLUCCO18]|nr:MAG: licheninase [Rhodobacteraceae bacterium HLUCCO18]